MMRKADPGIQVTIVTNSHSSLFRIIEEGGNPGWVVHRFTHTCMQRAPAPALTGRRAAGRVQACTAGVISSLISRDPFLLLLLQQSRLLHRRHSTQGLITSRKVRAAGDVFIPSYCSREGVKIKSVMPGRNFGFVLKRIMHFLSPDVLTV